MDGVLVYQCNIYFKTFKRFTFHCNLFWPMDGVNAGHISLLGQFYLFSVILSLNSLHFLHFIIFPMKVYLHLFTLQSSQIELKKCQRILVCHLPRNKHTCSLRLLEILDTVTHKEQSRHSCTAVIACLYLLVKKPIST